MYANYIPKRESIFFSIPLDSFTFKTASLILFNYVIQAILGDEGGEGIKLRTSNLRVNTHYNFINPLQSASKFKKERKNKK